MSSLVKFENALGADDVDDKKKQEEKRKNQVGLELCAHTLTAKTMRNMFSEPSVRPILVICP